MESLPDDRLLRNAVFKATYRLFSVLIGDPTAEDSVARRVVPRIRSLGARREFVKIVGKNEGGSRIVSERVASELENGVV